MRFLNRLTAVAVFCLLTTGADAAATIYEIEWQSARIPCGATVTAGLSGPLINSSYADCPPYGGGNGAHYTICPGNVASPGNLGPTPWATPGTTITIIGARVTCTMDDPTKQCAAEVGSASWNNALAADVLAKTAGVGSNEHETIFPAGTGVPQGGHVNASTHLDDYDHLDVYGACDGGSGQNMQISVEILYTSP